VLSAKVAQKGIILSDEQVAALEKAKAEKEAHREIETHRIILALRIPIM
jgi:hypothetical protein